MRFECDANKASANFAKHGVHFKEAVEVFYDPNALEDYDAKHSTNETRFFIIGRSIRRLLFVVYAEVADDTVRIISARKATTTERKIYERRAMQ